MNRGEFVVVWIVACTAGAAVLALLHARLGSGRPRDHRIDRTISASFLALLCAAIGLPILDLSGERRGAEAIVRAAFALPADAAIDLGRRKSQPICWSPAVVHAATVTLSRGAFDRYAARRGDLSSLARHVAEHHGTDPARIEVREGALDWRRADPEHDLRDGRFRTRGQLAFALHEFVCADIDALDEAAGRYALDPCDPLERPARPGAHGRITAVLDARERRLDVRLAHASAPRRCTNPVRRALNDAFGLPHPE